MSRISVFITEVVDELLKIELINSFNLDLPANAIYTLSSKK